LLARFAQFSRFFGGNGEGNLGGVAKMRQLWLIRAARANQ
jgi:hypothetical protein